VGHLIFGRASIDVIKAQRSWLMSFARMFFSKRSSPSARISDFADKQDIAFSKWDSMKNMPIHAMILSQGNIPNLGLGIKLEIDPRSDDVMLHVVDYRLNHMISDP
jgi:hypothetical protein